MNRSAWESEADGHDPAKSILSADPPPGSPLEGLDGQLMAMAAHRYCLGRRSYIAGSCVSWLRRWWSQLDQNTRNVILRDTVEALQDNLAGGDSDVREWRVFAKWAWLRAGEEDRRWCQGAVAHRNKPWPLDPQPNEV